MDLLTNNPLINLRGPAFLGVYVIIAIVIIVIARNRIRKMDRTARIPVPMVPQEIDPFEIAFMRGGYPEYARLTILDLIARGYLEVKLDGVATIIAALSKTPDPRYLDLGARYVFDWMRTGRRVDEIMPVLPEQLKYSGIDAHLQQELESRQILTTEEHRKACEVKIWPFAGILAGLSCYRLFVAVILRGHVNVMFLVILTIFVLFVLYKVMRPGRLTALGKAYLKRVQEALSGLQHRAQSLITGHQRDHLLLAVSAFGISVLNGTSYSFFPTIFERAARKSESDDGSSDSGCGSSCGSSCGGGGGCGGCGGGGD